MNEYSVTVTLQSKQSDKASWGNQKNGDIGSLVIDFGGDARYGYAYIEAIVSTNWLTFI